MQVSTTHLVLIPSYNPGKKVIQTVTEALAHWSPVWVVVDGSTDGSLASLQTLALSQPNLKVLALPVNSGKGAAVLHGVEVAQAQGFTHALAMDSDGQHPADKIPQFMQISNDNPQAMILGEPEFDSSAPMLRVRGRRVSNWWVNLETVWMGIHDSLFGFRVYPIAPLRQVMQGQRWMRRFDFDGEAVVRLCWRGVKPINVKAPCQYIHVADGGVSHFKYGRDNVLLTWMHSRLFFGFLLRLPVLLWRKWQA
jgi:glycosyltransferase involved in cell wall biosynthesis